MPSKSKITWIIIRIYHLIDKSQILSLIRPQPPHPITKSDHVTPQCLSLLPAHYGSSSTMWVKHRFIKDTFLIKP